MKTKKKLQDFKTLKDFINFYSKLQQDWHNDPTIEEYKKNQEEIFMPLEFIPEFSLSIYWESIDYKNLNKYLHKNNIGQYTTDSDDLADWCIEMRLNSNIKYVWLNYFVDRTIISENWNSKVVWKELFQDEENSILWEWDFDQITIDYFVNYILND